MKNKAPFHDVLDKRAKDWPADKRRRIAKLYRECAEQLERSADAMEFKTSPATHCKSESKPAEVIPPRFEWN